MQSEGRASSSPPWPVKDKQRSCSGFRWSSEYACGKIKEYIQQAGNQVFML